MNPLPIVTNTQASTLAIIWFQCSGPLPFYICASPHPAFRTVASTLNSLFIIPLPFF